MREVADELSADAGDGKARILLMTMTVEPPAVLGPALGQDSFRSKQCFCMARWIPLKIKVFDYRT